MYQCTRRAAFPQAMSIGCRRGVWSSKAAHTKQSLAGALGDHRQKAKSENTLERIHHLHHSIPLAPCPPRMVSVPSPLYCPPSIYFASAFPTLSAYILPLSLSLSLSLSCLDRHTWATSGHVCFESEFRSWQPNFEKTRHASNT